MMTNDISYTYSEYNNRMNSYASTTDAKDIRHRRSILINAKERPASAIFFANASHPLPQAEQIDEWFESLTQFEDVLEDMAKVSLDNTFRDELNAIDQWFSVLSEAEKTAALYNLLQHASDIQIRFFITILQQMAKMEPQFSPTNDLYPTKNSTPASPGFKKDNISVFKQKDVNTHQGFNYNNSNKNNQFNINSLDNSFKTLSTDKNDLSYNNSRTFANNQRSAFSNNGWELDNFNQEEKVSFGTSNKSTSLRDSGVFNDIIDPKLLSYNNLNSSNSINWRQKSISNTSMALSEAISNRRSIYLERSNSITDTDPNFDWKSQSSAAAPQDLPSANNVPSSPYNFGSSTINGPALGNLVSSTLGTSPGGSKIYSTGPRQSFDEKDRNSVRWSTLSESLDSFIPMNKDRQSNTTNNILDYKSNADRRSISNRLSIVLNSARDLGHVSRPNQTEKYYSNIATSPLATQNSNNLNYNVNATNNSHIQLQNKYANKNSSLQQNQSKTQRSYGVFPRSTTNSFKSDHDDQQKSPVDANPGSKNNTYSNSKNFKEFSNVNHDRATDLIKQKAAALRNGIKSSQDQTQHNPSYQKPNVKPLAETQHNSNYTLSDNKSVDKNTFTVDLELIKDVPVWMKTLRLHKYTPCFEGMHYPEIVNLNDKALEALGVHALGARRKMLKVFEQVKAELNL
ncbi:hypothetical protein BB561_006161 [Smittium simulii]|uniref:SAM domain-containing protein n=1 Tax=Smittium simulii TaxID=133385 RepID=A0A2T9Y640_9FUNG|nr:hypothetical protein BB561_006161 [Smittium simulii]